MKKEEEEEEKIRCSKIKPLILLCYLEISAERVLCVFVSILDFSQLFFLQYA